VKTKVEVRVRLLQAKTCQVFARKQPEARREAGVDSLLQFSEETILTNILTSDFWPPEQWAQRFLLLKPHNLHLFVMVAIEN
jgi:hypothetical protein